MSFFQAVRLAWDTIRVQKLKSFFTLHRRDDRRDVPDRGRLDRAAGWAGTWRTISSAKIIAVNTFNLRRVPGHPDGRRDRGRVARVAAAPADHDRRRRTPWSRRSRPASLWAMQTRRGPTLELEVRARRAAACSARRSRRRLVHRSRRWASTQGRLFSAAGIHARRAGGRDRQGRRRSLLPEPRSDRPRAPDSGHSYTVIGVAEKQGSVFGMSLDKFGHRARTTRRSTAGRIRTARSDGMIVQAPTTTGCARPHGDARAR